MAGGACVRRYDGRVWLVGGGSNCRQLDDHPDRRGEARKRDGQRHAHRESTCAGAIALRERNTRALDSFLTQLDSPGSPAYGHPLTAAQFTARFAPTAAAANAVASYLRSEGFSDVAVTSNRLFVTASGSAA